MPKDFDLLFHRGISTQDYSDDKLNERMQHNPSDIVLLATSASAAFSKMPKINICA
jgi:hypothetical protein